MADSTHNRKTIKKINLPSVETPTAELKKTLPFNGKAVSEKSFSFSFACFDRSHELFNLGDYTATGTVSANWFLDFLDCLKSVSNMNTSEMKASLHDLHPIDWSKTNTSAPAGGEQHEYWQFRINKSKGRVIGFPIDGVFYIVWLDPHHNLTNSEGYGAETYFKAGMSLYEKQELKLQRLKEDNEQLKGNLQAAEALIEEYLKQK
jgi:hypothetical protein